MSDPDPITRLNAALEGRYRVERERREEGVNMNCKSLLALTRIQGNRWMDSCTETTRGWKGAESVSCAASELVATGFRSSDRQSWRIR